MPRVPDALASAPVLDAAGAPHALRDFWAERTAVVVFLRHFS
jgi:hypothetical protein